MFDKYSLKYYKLFNKYRDNFNTYIYFSYFGMVENF